MSKEAVERYVGADAATLARDAATAIESQDYVLAAQMLAQASSRNADLLAWFGLRANTPA